MPQCASELILEQNTKALAIDEQKSSVRAAKKMQNGIINFNSLLIVIMLQIVYENFLDNNFVCNIHISGVGRHVHIYLMSDSYSMYK